MKKHLFLTSLAAIIATTGVAGAVESTNTVDAAGNYITSVGTKNIAEGAIANTAYEYTYTATAGTENTNLGAGVDLNKFYYTSADGLNTDIKLTEATKDGSVAAYAGTSVAGTTGYENVAVANNALVADGELSSYSYGYKYMDANGAEQTVSGVAYDPKTTAAADNTETVKLSDKISGTLTIGESTESIADFVTIAQDVITVTNGTADYAVSAGLFSVKDPDYPNNEYTLVKSADDSLKLQKAGTTEDVNITNGSKLESVFNAVKQAYNDSVTAVANAATNTSNAHTANVASYEQAANAYTADGNALEALTTRYGTYKDAVSLYATATDATKNTSLATAQQNQSDDSTYLTNAKKVYASDLTNIKDAEGNSVYASVSDLANKADADSVYTKTEADGLFLTEHQDISGKANISDLGSAAYTDSTAYATAAQGATADATAATIATYGDVVTHNVSEFATAAQGALADSALQLADITTGSANGTIRVKDKDVAVFGLGSAAYADMNAFDLAGSAATAEANANDYTDTVAAGLRADFATADINVLNSANAYTHSKVKELERNVSGGVAAATALSAVSVGNVERGEVSVGGGYGYYNGQSAMAFGAAMGLTDRWSINAGAGLASGDSTQFSIRAGTNYKFKLF